MDAKIIESLKKAAQGQYVNEETITQIKNADGSISYKQENKERYIPPNVSAAVLLREMEQQKRQPQKNTLKSLQADIITIKKTPKKKAQ